MLIWIASYPRSGNTFFRYVLTQAYGCDTYENYAENQAWDAVPVEDTGLPFEQRWLSQNEMDDDRQYFMKTHDLPKGDNPAIYIVRDGRDALISHAHFIINFDLGIVDPKPALFRDTLRSIIESDHSFGGWSGNVNAWLGRSAPTAIVRFEDLISAPLESARLAMQSIGLLTPEIHNAEFFTFDDLHRLNPKFFRKGITSAWREEMPRKLHRLFWKRHGETMHRLGYPPANREWAWPKLDLFGAARR